MDIKLIETRLGLLRQGAAALKEKIEIKTQELRQAELDLTATLGAIQENTNWLNQLAPAIELGDILEFKPLEKEN